MAMLCSSRIPSMSSAQLQASLSKMLSTVISQGLRDMKETFGTEVPPVTTSCTAGGVFLWNVDDVPSPTHLIPISQPKHLFHPSAPLPPPMTPKKTLPSTKNGEFLLNQEVKKLSFSLSSMSQAPMRQVPQPCTHLLYNPLTFSKDRAITASSSSANSSSSIHRKLSLNQNDKPCKALRQIKLTDMMVVKKRRSQSFKGSKY